MATSQQKIDTNRANAQKSTGPKTASGKERSRANALKHGLTGAGVVVPPEDFDRFERRANLWAQEIHAETDLDRFLMRKAALSSVRMERCTRAETAQLDEKRERAIYEWLERKDEGRVEDSFAKLDVRPAQITAFLHRSILGCEAMVWRWDRMRYELERNGNWGIINAAKSLRLLGIPGEPPASEGSRGSELWGTCFAVAIGNNQYGPEMFERFIGIASPTPIEFAEAVAALPPPEEGNATLMGLCDAEIERLTRLRDAMWADLGGPEFERVVALAEFDDGEGGQLRRRYETANSSELHRAIDQVHKNQKAALAMAKAAEDRDASPRVAGPERAEAAQGNSPQAPSQDEVKPKSGDATSAAGKASRAIHPEMRNEPTGRGPEGVVATISRDPEGRKTGCSTPR